jgi:pimeloyl-ACP methyl ester carboxylesterase
MYGIVNNEKKINVPWSQRMKRTGLLITAAAFVFMAFFGSLTADAVECQRPPLPQALEALASDSSVDVATVVVDSWDGTTPAPADDNIYYSFVPKLTVPTVGFIILPGGNCDPRSYAPAAREIAAQGFLTVIIPMPNCVAIPGYERADKIIDDYGKIKKWVIGGHSVGGTAAGIYAQTSDKISGVVIWASIAAPGLENTTIKVLLVYGSLDGRATPEMVKENAVYLPADTVFVEIEGGNHTQFGWIDPSPYTYFDQDNAATITIEEQQKQIVQATTDFLQQFKETICPVVYLLGKEDPRVTIVRTFRDELLAKSSSGRDMINLYKNYGAALIQIFEKSPMFKSVARKLLEFGIPVLQFLL